MADLSISGIYSITHRASGRVYVGSAVNIQRRWQVHLNDLRRGDHRNSYLQNAFRKYGEAAFDFAVLEEVDDLARLIAREQAHIDQRQAASRKYGYNIAPKAGSQLGFKHSEKTRALFSRVFKGRKHSEEARREKSERTRGRTFSPETRRRLSVSHARHSKLNDGLVRHIFELAGDDNSFHRIAAAMGISVPNVARIIYRRTWAWVVVPPETVAKAQELAHRRRNEKGKPNGLRGTQCGESNPCSKLTADQVREIRRLKESGETDTSVARRFGVTPVTVSNIFTRKKWKHI